MALDLKKDFYRFHENVVGQMSTGFQQLETAVRDLKERLLQDVGPLLSAKDQKFESLNLRVLGGQQNLSQNLDRIEESFNHAVRSGEHSVAARIQGQLSEQQAATRALFDSLSQCQQHAMHLHLQQLVRLIPSLTFTSQY